MIGKQTIRQFSEKEAIALYELEVCKEMSDLEIVKLQLFQDRLCVPFGRFHKAV